MEPNDRLIPASPDTDGAAPERRCILTQAHGPRASLIRLALGPDGSVAADLGERVPGRGAWIVADRAVLVEAMARGRLRGALARAFRSQEIRIPDDLPDRIADGLERRAMDRLGLENRAGNLIWGLERISEALVRRRVALLMHAADARPDGIDKLEARRRAIVPDTPSLRLPVDRARLSVALGRENIVHAAITGAGGAARVLAELTRWQAFTGGHHAQADEIQADHGAETVAVPAAERH